MTVLIRNAAYLVRSSDRIEQNRDVLVKGSRIAGIGHYEPRPGWDVIDASGCAVTPGLINAHAHLYQSFLKGLNDQIALVDWCDEVLFPAAYVIHAHQRRVRDERLGYAWSLVAALEMIKAGTTCCINMDMTMDAVFHAWLDIGFRGVGAVTLVDQWIPQELQQPSDVSCREALGFHERWHQVPADNPRVQVALAPSAPFLSSHELFGWTREQRDRLDLAVQIHVAETRYEVERIVQQTGTTPLRYLDRMGLVDERLTAVHCVHLDDADLALIQARRVIPVHCPKSNMKLGSGVAPVAEMLRRGIPVALANEGAASNDLLDMFEEMRFAALLQKVAAKDASVISAPDVFRMATENGAKACRIDAGTIDPGRLADLIIVNLHQPHLVPVHDVLGSLVFCAKGSDVETSIINGQVIMRGRKLLTMDEASILDKAEEWGAYLREQSIHIQPHPAKPRTQERRASSE